MPAGWNLSHTYAELPAAFHAPARAATFESPRLVWFNDDLAADLSLNRSDADDATWAAWLSGQTPVPGSRPLAMAYAGHQFGGFTMLGDGRAMLLGEQVTPEGRRFDVQLKGAGPTPFARRGDGRATIGPMLREAIIGEAMHHLRIPTTRALAVVTTGDEVYRQFGPEPGAVLTRVAAGHIRVGTMQYAAARGGVDDATRHADQIALVDYTIERHAPQLASFDAPDRYRRFLDHVIHAQADLVASWMSVGFVHGVLNTDNVSLAGETIDYGPCAFMDRYDPATVFSSIDTGGRYAYGNQPAITGWNLTRLAESMVPVLASADGPPAESQVQSVVEAVNGQLSAFPAAYDAAFDRRFAAKIGFDGPDETTSGLIDDLLTWMQTHDVDFTQTFRNLVDIDADPAVVPADWRLRRDNHLKQRSIRDSDAAATMAASNPAVIPRNVAVEEALAAACRGEFGDTAELIDHLNRPFEDRLRPINLTTVPPADATAYQTYCGT